MERWSMLVYDVHLTVSQDSGDKHGSYILLQQSGSVAQNLRHQIATLKDTFGWNPRSNFVIVIQTQKPKKLKQLLKEIVRQLWLSNIVNFVILISNSTHPVVTAYSWFPYNPTVLCGGVKTPVFLDKCIKDSEGNAYFLNNASLFPPKVPQDLHGCTITVSTFELEPTVMRHAINNEGYARGWMYEDGLELRLLKVLLEKINMSAVFRQAIPNPWGKIFKNGTWTGILGEVQRRESDVAFGGVIIDEWRWKAVDMTIPYIWDSMKWHVPCAKPMLRWMSLTMVFTPTLWVVFAIVYVAMSFFMWLLVKIHGWLRQKKSQYYSSLVKCFLYMWGVILGVSSPDEVPSSSTIRYVFFMWLVFCLAFNTVYQTYLTSFLIDPGLQHQLSSEDEILNSGLKFGYHTLFTLRYKDLTQKRYSRSTLCTNITLCLKRLAEKGDYAFLTSDTLSKHMRAYKYMDSSGKPLFCNLDDSFAHVWYAMCFQRGSPFLDRFNFIIRCVLQAGLIDQWQRELKYKGILYGKKYHDYHTENDDEYQVLSLSHLQSVFYVLALGSFLSCIVCLCEVARYAQKIEETRHQHRFSVNIWAGVLGERLRRPFKTFLLTYCLLAGEWAMSAGLQMWFMQDGARAHFLRNVREHLTLTFQDHCSGRGSPTPWAARFPNLKPLDFWLWGHMKRSGQFQRMRDSSCQRTDECIAMNGRQIELLL
ncbi:probable glutamate receptor [Periplaneta americana]|uniref:probable glutamate receptor n=1 Tax=Periplaneta americana TaxID=6978 RepID=UPI0037E913B2